MPKNELKFYGHRDEKYGWLSNLYETEIWYNNKKWDSVESAYQFAKFKDARIGNLVISMPDQKYVAMTGHLFNREAEKYYIEGWDLKKVAIMSKLLVIKFSNSALKKKLLDTKDRYLIENSKSDYVWGCGAKGTGRNLLGKLLMEVRDLYQANPTVAFKESPTFQIAPKRIVEKILSEEKKEVDDVVD